ncbi:MAG TPA: ABC transporter ATP-binding protein, partial [Chitinophagaceae bacterium]|nr:ABC transporter ATP-binding protein [Chitinophagaceae bacterium]
MGDTVIKVEGVSKQYRLGQIGRKSLSQDFNRWWHMVRGKEDPYLKIGQENDRSKKGTSEYVWALQDINFDVKQGEVLGIIGRNGAGKSTLLKILSKVTAPTKGSIKVKGRIASLLEVGTGFHPELSGRDNIFLNGAILGMTKKEITSKFDEIVDFAGVERYIDTPVKRYSSGMYVRLAFAVAAHLEPEILIVDEVLAVGDAEFQKKCLGKMKDVSVNDGRTVLFVSHNMAAVKTLCDRTVALKNGLFADDGNPHKVINKYLNDDKRQYMVKWDSFEEAPGNRITRIKIAEIFSRTTNNIELAITEAFSLRFEVWLRDDKLSIINFSLNIFNSDGLLLLNTFTTGVTIKSGVITGEFDMPQNLFNTGTYSVELMVVKNYSQLLYCFADILKFDMVENKRNSAWLSEWQGLIRPVIPSHIDINNE